MPKLPIFLTFAFTLHVMFFALTVRNYKDFRIFYLPVQENEGELSVISNLFSSMSV